MALKPWYKVDGITPRQDLRDGVALEASEFAVHLDQVRDGKAPADYKDPQRFFERTYLTKYLTELSAQVVRRLSGITSGANSVFNLSTQFGGGKTHSLTLLYHLAKCGAAANKWVGVRKILNQAGIDSVPEAAVAVFVGTEFDSLTGRGGEDGTPKRRTPWGEIAFQLGGKEAFEVVAQHEAEFIEPAGDVIRAFLPKDKPCLILMDEIINYVSRYRRKGYNNRLFNFIQNLSETARGLDNVVLVVSIPASELEYTAEDETDEQRFKKMLDRVGKAVMVSAESETSEIIRRRLFEWNESAVSGEGRVLLTREAENTCREYAEWVVNHRQQLPDWFSVDRAFERFKETYPFHPTVLSVFERKWQALPRFQRTRGVLRMLALWVSHAYQDGYKGAHKDPIIGLGTAPLEDPGFRPVLYEQLGTDKLEAAITTDICGKKDAHAIRLDKEASAEIEKARLHQKVATAIFFESNGGQTKTEATLPEIRLAVAEPELNIANVETVLESLTDKCYYLSVKQTKYQFSISPNLNKLLADRRASIQDSRIEERVRTEIQRVFSSSQGLHIVPFPESPSNIANQPALTLAVLSPDHCSQDKDTIPLIETMIKEAGTAARTYKSALIFAYVDSNAQLLEDARKLLAWEDI
jgi:predicted AAA+ superfamily ATPase